MRQAPSSLSDSGKPDYSALGWPAGDAKAFSFRSGDIPYDQKSLFRGYSGSRLLLSLSLRGNRDFRAPAGVAIGFIIQVLYLGSPRFCGMEANALLRRPPSLEEAARSQPSPRARAVVPRAASSRGPPGPACPPRPFPALALPPAAPWCGPVAVTSGLLLGRRGRRCCKAGLGGTNRTWAR